MKAISQTLRIRTLPPWTSKISRCARLRSKKRVYETALNAGEFVPFFQPLINADTRELAGLEVLARWIHPICGPLAPSEFLDDLEKLGLKGDLDQQLFDAALELRGKWSTALNRLIPMSFNISVERLSDPTLPTQIAALGEAAKKISLELVETIYLDEPDQAIIELVHQLRNMGARIEIDDFGTGKTSLLALTAFRPNGLKLDKRLVLPTVNSNADRQVVASIIDIARHLDMPVIAEGIETKAHADLMTDLGCDCLQGYLFGRPMPASEVLLNLLTWSPQTQGFKD